MRRAVLVLTCGFLVAFQAASQNAIPRDEAGFTSYIQAQLQPYSPLPITIVRPLQLSWTTVSGSIAYSNLNEVRIACSRDPENCPKAVHDYVQEAAREMQEVQDETVQSPPTDNTLFPGDEAAFMASVVTSLRKLLPDDEIESGGYRLTITRPGGHPLKFNARALYQDCSMLDFRCGFLMTDHLTRMRDALTTPQSARLHLELRAIQEGAERFTDPMGYFFRGAFSNLKKICVKEIDGGRIWPMTSADRDDLDLDTDSALALCEKDTQSAIGPIPASPRPSGIVTVTGRDASIHAVLTADWTALANESGGHLLMAVPTRDTLLYTEVDSPAQVAAMAVLTERKYSAIGNSGVFLRLAVESSSADDHRLSEDVYRWTNGGWTLATPEDMKTPGTLPTFEVMP